MDLKTCLKYILSIALCLGYSKMVKSMHCKIGGLIQKPDISVECYPFSETFKLPKENCQILSCKTNETIEWKIIDPKKGELQIQFYGVDKHCNYEAYEVELEVYNENANYEESFMCDTRSLHWKTHSKRIVLNTQCPYCPSEECTVQVYKTNFKYVFPGFYRLKVTPYIDGSTRQAQRSYRIHINSTTTRYVKKKFTDLHLNASLQYRNIPEELDLGIPLLIDDLPEEMKIEVKFSYDYIDVYEITKFAEYENSTSISCENSEKKNWPSCQVHNRDLLCKFYNMSQGFYSVYISFKDDRCMGGTIWVQGQTDPCYWVIKKEFTVDETIADAIHPYNESTPSQILYTSVIVVIVVGVIIISFIVKKLNKKKRGLRNGTVGEPAENCQKNNTEQVYNFNTAFTNKFNFGQLLTLNEKPRPEVLLVYTRETPAFMELITCLRRVLDKIFKCQVYDYFNPDLWNDVSEDPKGWVHALIVERQAKVMIIASEVAAIRHRSLMGEFPTRSYKTPHPFDHLFLYALRLVRDNVDGDSYKNHFIITFDGFTESSHVLEYFNPYTRFVLPKHLNKLFEHLHDSNITLHFDTNKLEERYEVRQLRLQLEHLINLKLLANSDADKRKLYDW